MDSSRILKTRSNIYQIVRGNRSSASTSTRPKRSNSKSKPKLKPLQNIEAANKLPSSTGLFSPASSVESLLANDSEYEDSDEEVREVQSLCHSDGVPNDIELYKDRMKDLAKTYQEIIDRQSPSITQQMNPYPSRCSSSPPSILPMKRNNRRSQEDINDANLLLFLGMIE